MLPFLSMEHVQQQQQQQQLPPLPQSKTTASRPSQQPFKKLSISMLVISMPLLYVSFLHVPPSTLFKDTTFWFLMSNSIIIIIATDSGMFFSPSSSISTADDDLYNKLVTKHDKERHTNQEAVACTPPHANAVMEKSIVVKEELARPANKVVMITKKKPTARQPKQLVASKSLETRELLPVQDRNINIVAVPMEKALQRSATEGRKMEESDQYSNMSDEELNKRVEEFITRFNREIRLQLESEGV